MAKWPHSSDPFNVLLSAIPDLESSLNAKFLVFEMGIALKIDHFAFIFSNLNGKRSLETRNSDRELQVRRQKNSSVKGYMKSNTKAP